MGIKKKSKLTPETNEYDNTHFNRLGFDHCKCNLPHAHIFYFAQFDGCGPENSKSSRFDPIALVVSAFHFRCL